MDVDQLLAQAQVSVLATNWEGFPLSILESMRAGLPVIASAVGGIEEAVIDEETGYLVPRGDVIRLRQRIERLLTAPSLRTLMGLSARNRYEQQFTLDVSLKKTLAVYEEVVAKGRPRLPRSLRADIAS
jgi:glycosyltransferase involved in cell wall biosynthesis